MIRPHAREEPAEDIEKERDALKARVAELEAAGRELVVYEWGDPAKGFEIAPTWGSEPDTRNIWRRFAKLVGVLDKSEDR